MSMIKPAPPDEDGAKPDTTEPSAADDADALRTEPKAIALEAPTPEPCTDTIDPPLAGPLRGHTDSTSEPPR